MGQKRRLGGAVGSGKPQSSSGGKRWTPRITARKLRFLRELLAGDGNVRQAALNAGYSESVSRSEVYRPRFLRGVLAAALKAAGLPDGELVGHDPRDIIAALQTQAHNDGGSESQEAPPTPAAEIPQPAVSPRSQVSGIALVSRDPGDGARGSRVVCEEIPRLDPQKPVLPEAPMFREPPDRWFWWRNQPAYQNWRQRRGR